MSSACNDFGPASATWRIVQPAPRSAALELAGGYRLTRARVLAQVRDVDSVAIYRGDQPMAVAMFGRHGWKRVEMALAISRDAAPHMRRLIRFAQLTLPAMAETRLIVAFVRPANVAGARMAMLVGFRRARLKQAGLWVFEGDRYGLTFQRRQCGEASGGREPQDATGGE